MSNRQQRRAAKKRSGGVLNRSDIPFSQRIRLQQHSDIVVSREHAAKVAMYCMSVAMHEIKGVGYKRLIRYHHRYMDYDREFYQDVDVGMAHAKTRMEQMGMPISGEFFTDKVEGLSKRAQEVRDNTLQSTQAALIIGAIAMNDEFGFGQDVQLRIQDRTMELAERYGREGVAFLLEELKKIGFEIVNGTVCAYLDADGNAVTPKRAKKEGFVDA